MNQVVEAYLRCYINYQQNNWVELLLLAEFVYNSSTTEITKVILFFANYGYEPVAYREPNVTVKDNDTAPEKNAHYYNKNRSQEPTLQEGDRVYLLRKNINTQRPSDKLDHKKLGPFKIKRVKGPLNRDL
ncbi:uncharacterized protein RAG0_06338 [Rhynchosporium agropyri]|uniref:Integrase catalytic domain-containing protein n=1 Tax=Rhynchosporium agropyri TaxID=914238 RepID=A0A1E1KGK5_9HELO|nr:uncharacterized protein RAG0_06338 [Rhynchosporium agropyri]